MYGKHTIADQLGPVLERPVIRNRRGTLSNRRSRTRTEAKQPCLIGTGCGDQLVGTVVDLSAEVDRVIILTHLIMHKQDKLDKFVQFVQFVQTRQTNTT